MFGKVAGPVLNMSKTEALTFKETRTLYAYKKIKWVTDSVKCLGIYFGPNKIANKDHNWHAKITNIDKLISKWKSRTLTIYGKVAIVNCLAIPQMSTSP